MTPLQAGQQSFKRKATNTVCCIATEKVITEKLQKTTNSTTLTQFFINTTPTFAHLLHGVDSKRFGDILL